jgi:hypothetical protein
MADRLDEKTMTEQQFLTYWYRGIAIAVGVVVAVAALLLAIIATARNILNNAKRAIAVANDIVANTRPIWELEQTNAVATQLLDGVEAIEHHATEIADALETPQPAD